MDKKRTLLITVLALALALGGAYWLYNNLQDRADTNQLATLPQINQSKPTEGTNPTMGTQPTEGIQSTEGTKPTESTQPTQPTEGTKPTESTQPTQPTESAKPTIPYDFTVYDAAGQPVKLSDFVGKPVVLNFWASWCSPCKREMPEFQDVYDQMKDRVHFVMVNATGGRETVDTAKSFINQSGYTFPVFYDTAGEASATYQVYSLPTTYFISADGTPVTYAVGSIDKDTLLKGISMITE